MLTVPVSTRETGVRLALRSASELCELVDRLGRSSAGELVVRARGGEVRGAVFVEGGRICWAAARGLARRLTELLAHRSVGVGPREMEEYFRLCRDEGVPLGELLVERGIVRPADLREALLEHTTESLARLCAADSEAEWCLRGGRGYSPRFTFATAEVLARSIARELPADDGVALPEIAPLLATCFADAEWGVAFLRGSGAAPLPCAVQGDLPDTVMDVLRVGKWAASALDLASTFQGDDAVVLTLDHAGVGSLRRAFVAWRHRADASRQVIVAGRVGPQGPARILNRRAAARRASG